MLAGGEKSRVDTRVTAMLRGTLRDSRGTREVRIGDISPKGLLGTCEKPPERGDVVDIAVGRHHLVGQVRWVAGRRFGVRSRERIDVAAIMGVRKSKKPPPKFVQEAEIEEEATYSNRGLLIAYGVLGLTAFCTAYVIVNWFIL